MAQEGDPPNVGRWTTLFATLGALVAAVLHGVIAYYAVTGYTFDWLEWERQVMIQALDGALILGLASRAAALYADPDLASRKDRDAVLEDMDARLDVLPGWVTLRRRIEALEPPSLRDDARPLPLPSRRPPLPAVRLWHSRSGAPLLPLVRVFPFPPVLPRGCLGAPLPLTHFRCCRRSLTVRFRRFPLLQ
jgi:hypothetical protein